MMTTTNMDTPDAAVCPNCRRHYHPVMVGKHCRECRATVWVVTDRNTGAGYSADNKSTVLVYHCADGILRAGRSDR